VADVPALVKALTLEEKASLTAGGGMMATAAVERVGIPAIGVTDGPNGARGPSSPGLGGPPSICTPCGSALGATWDEALVERVASLIAREALDRGCRGLLAPTVNLHRSPLAGRNFECFSEDPLLTGRLGAAYVRGVQANGVFATVKHFVGNEAEFERSAIDSVIDERSLRELYLLPFEMAVRDGGALSLMTSYNRVNGRWLTEQGGFLIELLRDEWGFEGFVMTDWYGVVDGTHSLGEGLDLEMPGPGRALGSAVAEMVESGVLAPADLDAAVTRFLGGIDRIGALDAPRSPSSPRDPGPGDVELLCTAAVEATVLLTNDGVLPLATSSLRRVAVLGDHAAAPRVQGGGSARVDLRPVTTPLVALSAALGAGVQVSHERGCEVERSATLVGGSVLRAPGGFSVDVFQGLECEGEVLASTHLDELRLFVFNGADQGFPDENWSVRAQGTVVPDESGTFELVLAQCGQARVLVDDELLLDGFAPSPEGGDRQDPFGFTSRELVGGIELVEGVPVDVVVEYVRVDTMVASFRVGFRTRDTDGLMERAVAAAEAADVAVVFVGTTSEWETEGRDRSSLELPGRQEELVRRVSAVNPRTVVVVNAGAPVDLAWADQVGAVLQCWFGGQEMATALAEILVGTSEPAGRLPTTIPMKLQHSPSHGNFPGENGQVRYGEGLFMGYRGYEYRDIAPRFPFGFGLGYTRFKYGEVTVSTDTVTSGQSVSVAVEVRNIGDRAGSDVIQCYVAPQAPRLARPIKELKGFSKVHLESGGSTTVVIELDDRAFAYWDPGQSDWDQVTARFPIVSGQVAAQDRRSPGWQIDIGTYELQIGRSSEEIIGRVSVEIVS
jgi:beta-glucosidase